MIQGDLTVREFLAQLEGEQAEREMLISVLRKTLGESASTPPAHNHSNNHAAVTAVVTQKPRKKNQKRTMAEHLEDLLQEVKTPMSKAALRDLLLDRGLYPRSKKLLTPMYTAMTRRPHVFYKVGTGKGAKWALVEWRK